MRRRSKIGEARRFAGKPGTCFGEMAEISEMIAQVLMARPDRRDVGRAGVRVVTPVYLLINEIGGHLLVELAVEPVHEPARLGAGRRIPWEKLKAAGNAVDLYGLAK